MSIYIIRSKEPSLHDFYIGSTENMRDRGYQHKTNCKNEKRPHYNAKVYKFIRANGGWDNFQMVKIASVWGKATKSLFQIEQDYKDQYNPTLNTLRAYNSEEYTKEYRKEKNKEKIKCECGSTFRRDKKARHLRTNKHKSFIENN
jgi:hypothetical protein